MTETMVVLTVGDKTSYRTLNTSERVPLNVNTDGENGKIDLRVSATHSSDQKGPVRLTVTDLTGRYDIPDLPEVSAGTCPSFDIEMGSDCVNLTVRHDGVPASIEANRHS